MSQEEEYKAFLKWAKKAQNLMNKYGGVTEVDVNGTVVDFYQGDEKIESLDVAEYGMGLITKKVQKIMMKDGIDSICGEGTFSDLYSKYTNIKGIISAAKSMDKMVNYKGADDIDFNDISAPIAALTSAFGTEWAGPLSMYVSEELFLGNECLQKGKNIIMDHNRDILAAEMMAGFDYREELQRQADIYGVTPEDYLEKMYKLGDIVKETLVEALSKLGGEAAKARKADPVVIDLNGNKEITKNMDDGTHFDLNNDGFAEKTEWIENKDGFLVRDLNGNGIIDNGKELIGDGQALSNGKVSSNGLEVLQDMDTNKDKILDASDNDFDKLKVWIDKNGNGVTDENELYSLADLGIKGFRLNDSLTDGIKIGSAIKEDGTELILGDLFFNVDNIDSKEVDNIDIVDTDNTKQDDVLDELKRLPQIKPGGTVTNLRVAMQNDEILKNLVKEYCSGPKLANLENIDNILFEWCGVQDLAKNSRGSNIDARILGVVEKFTGNEFTGSEGRNPNSQAAVILKNMYNKIKRYIVKELDSQSYLAQYMCAIDGKYSLTKQEVYFDLNDLKKKIEDLNDPEQAAIVLRGLVNVYDSEGLIVNKLYTLVDEFSADSREFSNVYKIEKYIDNNTSNGIENGTNNNDYILANKETRSLVGGAGNDVLNGKSGNNTLNGGTGDDVYIYGRDYGNDVIDNSSSGSKDIDVLVMKDINYDDVYIQISGKDLILRLKDTGKNVMIKNYFSGGSYSLDEIQFADGKKMSYAEMVEYIDKNGMELMGTDGDDKLDYSKESVKLTINGGNGDDTITGSSNDDVIYGEDDNDILHGGSGNDYLNGGSRNDSLYGDSGDDTLDGDKGNDYLEGGTGNDTYIFGKGYGKDRINNKTSGTNDVDILKFKDINYDDIDILVSGNNLILQVKDSTDKITIENYFTGDLYSLEKIEFANGQVITYSEMVKYIQSKGIVVDGSDKDDTMDYSTEWVKLNAYGKNGDDIITGGTGDDKIYGEDGNDTLNGGAGNDYLYGGERNDTLHGNDGDDILDGGTGNDTLDGGAGNDTYIFAKGYGIDTIDNKSSVNRDSDVLIMKDINYDEIEMVVNINDLILNVKDSNDSIRIKDYFLGGSNSLETIKFADGKSISYNALVKEIRKNGMKVEGTDKDDNISKDDQWISFNIEGGKGNDVLTGGTGNDILNGGEDNDKLYGGAGDDILDGGAGDDYLNGDIGDDTYIFGKGYGKDTIDNISTASGAEAKYIDTVKMKDIEYNEVELIVSNNDLIIKVKETDDQVTLLKYFQGGVYGTRTEIEFSDGKTLYYNDVVEYIAAEGRHVKGTDKGDKLSFDTEWVKMIVQGEDGDDIITGGSGNDVLYGGNNNDTLTGGSGDDILYGDKDNDSLSGGIGNDILDGGAGNDTLDGGTGNDVYIFGKGYGKDIIDNYSSDTSDIDALKFEGLNYDDIEIAVSEKNLILKIKGTEDQVTIKNYLAGGKYCLEEIQFEDGTVLNYSDVIAYIDNGGIVINGTDEDDVLAYGNESAKLKVQGGNGNDIITTGSGNDTICGEDGNDTLSSSSGNNTFYGGNGNDTITGGSGNDIIYGGTGNDILDGRAGNDIYVFAKGDGSDVINNYKSGESDVDTLRFVDVNYDEINIEVSGNDLILRVLNSDDSVRISSYFSAGTYSLEKIEFADGKVMGYNDVVSYVNTNGIKIIGKKEDEVLNLSSEWVNINISGNEGNDTITGGSGNDTLDGGKGNDTLTGGNGNDTYIFKKGYGKDTINNYGSGDKDIDVLKFTDIKYSEVAIKIKGNDLTFKVKGTDDSVTIKNYFSGGSYSLEKVIFSDETTFTYDDIVKFAKKEGVIVEGTDGDDVLDYSTEWAKFNISGGNGDDTITPGSGNDVLRGGKGNDTINGGYGNDFLYGEEDNDKLYGGYGDDTLDGGIGNDYLSGEAGNDTYIFKKGYGKDVISNYNYYSSNSDVDVLRLPDINYDEVNIAVNNTDLILNVKNSEDQITIQNYFSGGKYSLEKIFFADDKTITYNEMLDYIKTTGSTIDGTEDDDILDYNTAWVKLNINGGDGDDTIKSGSGNDVLRGGKGNDTFKGGTGDDILYGEENNDRLDGGEGNDILDGGPGNDYLDGDKGNDTYIFKKGYGQDVINNEYSSDSDEDVLKLEDINFDEAAIDVVGNDLIIKVKNSDDQIKIQNYFSGGRYSLEKIYFADGKVFTYAEMSDYVKTTGINIDGTDDDDILDYNTAWAKLNINGGYGNDTIKSGSGNDVLRGGKGNDIFKGGTGDDLLYGDEDDDRLDGGKGNDILDGGTGNDYLDGDEGNDTYIFRRGYGQDIINNEYSLDSDVDVLDMKELNFDEVELRIPGKDLLIKIKGTEDSITVQNYFSGGKNSLESIEFKDKKLSYDDVLKYIKEVGMDEIGTDNDDVMNHSKANNVRFRMYGGLGNDKLYTGNVDDILDGGEGNDYLDGGKGNDTYIFGKGYGNDTINNYSSADSDVDILKLKDLNIDDVLVSKNNSDLVIKAKDSNDSVTIQNYFTGSTYSLESIEFADGTTKNPTEIQKYIDEQNAAATGTDTTIKTVKSISENYNLMNQVYCETSNEMPVSEVSYSNNMIQENKVNLFTADMK